MIRLLTHAGAWNTRDETAQQTEIDAVKASIEAAKGSPDVVSAVEKAAIFLENHPSLDAGFGSIIQMDGRIRMDAGIADSHGNYGAVVQIEEIQNPISVARRLMELDYHHILSGDGAKSFALEQGFPRKSVYTLKRINSYLQLREEIPDLSYESLLKDKEEQIKKKLSTIGAVAVDDQGNLAVASSTGGLSYGYPGRVGDSALLGHGMYCSKHVAVACTGHGEKIIITLLAQRVERYYLEDQDLQKAVDQAISDLGAAGGEGGIIAAAKDGSMAIGYNSSFLATHSEQIG